MMEYRILQKDAKYYGQYRDLRRWWPTCLTPWITFDTAGGYGEFVGGDLSWPDCESAMKWLKEKRAQPIPFKGRRVVGLEKS